jgi:hypothetical protein
VASPARPVPTHGASGRLRFAGSQPVRQIGADQVATILYSRVVPIGTVAFQIGHPLCHIPVAPVLRNDAILVELRSRSLQNDAAPVTVLEIFCEKCGS